MIVQREAPAVVREGRLPPFAAALRPRAGEWKRTPWYAPLWARLRGQQWPTHVLLWGGRGGGKSWVLAEYAVRLLRQLPASAQIVAFREVKEATRASIQATVHDVVHALGLAGEFALTDRETRAKSGARLRYMGVNPSAPASVESIKGLRDVRLALIDEAQWISERGLQLLLDTVIREDESQVVLAMNPEERDGAVQRMFLSGDPPDSSYVLRVNWYSNPWHTEKSELRRLDTKRRHGEAYYRHVWEGEVAPAELVGAVVDHAALEAAVRQWGSRADPTGQPLRVGVDLGVQGHRSTAVAMMVGGALYSVTLHAPPTWAEFVVELVERARALSARLGCSGVDVSYDAAGDQAASFVRALEACVGDATPVDADMDEYLGSAVEAPEFMAWPVAFGGAVAGGKRSWDQGVPNAAVFASRGAQLSMLFAQRCLNAKWADAGGDVDAELAFQLNPAIDDVDGFMRECTLPRWRRTGLGKRALEKAPGGADSPHRYDAVVLAMQADSAWGLDAAEWAGRVDADAAVA